MIWQFSRNISQSRWMIDDERMGEGSVQVGLFSSLHVVHVLFPSL